MEIYNIVFNIGLPKVGADHHIGFKWEVIVYKENIIDYLGRCEVRIRGQKRGER